MSTAYRRRVDALEQTIRPAVAEQEFERQLQEQWPMVERIAAEGGVSAEDLAEEMRRGARRAAEIGQDAYMQEMAAEIGITVEQLNDPEYMRARREQWQREDEAWQEKVRAQQAEQITWRGGVMYRCGVPVPDGTPPGRPLWSGREG